MGARSALREDYDCAGLRGLAKHSKDADQTRRLLALAAIYEGARRTEAAKIGGVTLQIIRDWVLRFNAEGPDGLIDRKAPGVVPKLTAAHRAALARIVDQGPIPAEVAALQEYLGSDTPIEIWFQDEARIGQKNKRTRRWARKGTRPSAPHDQRTKSA